MALVLGNGFGVGKWLWCWGMAILFANGYGVGEIGFFIFYFNFLAGFGAQVQESIFGRLFFQTLTISGAEWVFSEVRAGNHAAPQS
jgi:hypothetical protein